MTEQTQHSPLEEHALHRLTPANILPKQVFKQGSAGSVSGSDMWNNLEISTNSLPIKCFLKKVGGMENNSRVKVVVQNNFRFWSHENASPFSYSQTTRWENLYQGLQGPLGEEDRLQAHTDSKEWSSSQTQIPKMMLRHDGLTQPMDVRNFNGLGFMKDGRNDIIIPPAFNVVNGTSSRRACFHNGNGNPFKYNCYWSSACAGVSTQSNTLDPIYGSILMSFTPHLNAAAIPGMPKDNIYYYQILVTVLLRELPLCIQDFELFHYN